MEDAAGPIETGVSFLLFFAIDARLNGKLPTKTLAKNYKIKFIYEKEI
ncbi:MAG: hypothetical protein ACXVAY_03345 [Mucilaginibacter sp.]